MILSSARIENLCHCRKMNSFDQIFRYWWIIDWNQLRRGLLVWTERVQNTRHSRVKNLRIPPALLSNQIVKGVKAFLIDAKHSSPPGWLQCIFWLIHRPTDHRRSINHMIISQCFNCDEQLYRHRHFNRDSFVYWKLFLKFYFQG